MKTPEGHMEKFEEFKTTEKFNEDLSLFYPGIRNHKLKPILTDLINKAASDFKEVAQSDSPTDKKYLEKIDIGLRRFDHLYSGLDTEDRERICSYFEELMDIVGLQSSNGKLNEFIYGFDPNNSN